MRKNRFKGLASYDGMFSIIPILLLTVFLLNTMHYVLYDSVQKVNSQEKFNMLVVIADYVVKNADGGAYSDNEKVYPNLMEPSQINGLEERLRERAGMEELFIGLESGSSIPSDEKMCIYRIVVNRGTGEIDRLFVCG